MKNKKLIKMVQVMANMQVMQDVTENLVEATKKVVNIYNDYPASNVLDNISDISNIHLEDNLDKELKKSNKSIRKIVETIVEVLNSCPVIECQEITKEDSIKINVDKSVQDMLDKIGLVITEGDDDEHK